MNMNRRSGLAVAVVSLWLALVSNALAAGNSPVRVGDGPKEAVAHMLGQMKPGNQFAASSTYLYLYTFSESTGDVNYFGYSYIGSYTLSSAKAEVRSMGCSFDTRVSGSIIAPAYSSIVVDVYSCPYYNAYVGLGYFVGSSAVPSVFFYQLVP